MPHHHLAICGIIKGRSRAALNDKIPDGGQDGIK
jgi:hypothetical protein